MTCRSSMNAARAGVGHPLKRPHQQHNTENRTAKVPHKKIKLTGTDPSGNPDHDDQRIDCEAEPLWTHHDSSGQIEAEFKILQSLIPGVSSQPNVSQLEIIDACVDYIESLQSQLLQFYLKKSPVGGRKSRLHPDSRHPASCSPPSSLAVSRHHLRLR